MRSSSKEPEIIALAAALGPGPGDPAKSILAYCIERVRAVIRKKSLVTTIEELETVLCEELNLYINEIESDDGLLKLVQTHVAVGDLGFALLPQHLDEGTMGALMHCKGLNPDVPAPMVALVDCRGTKARRRFFTKWHEIAEALVTGGRRRVATSGNQAGHHAVERLIDMIAGELGFFADFFSPILRNEIERQGDLTFEGVERIRNNYCQDASYEATLRACIKQIDSPAVLIVAELGFKKREQQVIESGQAHFFPEDQPIQKLRVQNVLTNNAAQAAGLRVHKKMRVPDDCIISKVFGSREIGDFCSFSGLENLATWTTSDNRHLPDIEVTIQALRVRDRVFGLLTVPPSEPEIARSSSEGSRTARLSQALSPSKLKGS